MANQDPADGSRNTKLAILGTGNIGRALAGGLVASGHYAARDVLLTRRNVDRLADLADQGFTVLDDNRQATRQAATVIVAVEPLQLNGVLREIREDLEPEVHVVLSVVSGASISAMQAQIDKAIPVARAMPNTAVALRQSMTCLAARPGDDRALSRAREVFDQVGMTVAIDEEKMVPATALCACGLAFFLRSVRAASQGGIEIGFHPEDALTMAAQTALGAAALVLDRGRHPEREIDAVTTPRGCTIAGLNEMEHQGFSSAMIKGIVTSAVKADSLYTRDD